MDRWIVKYSGVSKATLERQVRYNPPHTYPHFSFIAQGGTPASESDRRAPNPPRSPIRGWWLRGALSAVCVVVVVVVVVCSFVVVVVVRHFAAEAVIITSTTTPTCVTWQHRQFKTLRRCWVWPPCPPPNPMSELCYAGGRWVLATFSPNHVSFLVLPCSIHHLPYPRLQFIHGAAKEISPGFSVATLQLHTSHNMKHNTVIGGGQNS